MYMNCVIILIAYSGFLLSQLSHNLEYGPWPMVAKIGRFQKSSRCYFLFSWVFLTVIIHISDPALLLSTRKDEAGISKDFPPANRTCKKALTVSKASMKHTMVLVIFKMRLSKNQFSMVIWSTGSKLSFLSPLVPRPEA